MFVYPDRPGGTISRDHLKDIDPKVWFATVKQDGWRCIVERKDGVFTYTSRANKPIDIPTHLRLAFEANFEGWRDPVNGVSDFVLDTEVTGNRRKGDVEGFFILEALEMSGYSYRMIDAISRYMVAKIMWPKLVVPFAGSDFREFFDYHKEHTPLAEGIVLKKRDSKLIGSTVACAENPNWIRCKWRAGSSGLSPTEY